MVIIYLSCNFYNLTFRFDKNAKINEDADSAVRKRTKVRICTLILGILLGSVASGDVVTPHPEAAKLHAVFDKHWNREMSEYPTWASQLGDRRFNSNWTDLSAEGRTRRRSGNVAALADVRDIDRELLPETEQVNYELFERRYLDRIEGQQFDMDLIPIDQRGGIQTQDELGDIVRMTTVQDFDDWLARLDKFDTLMQQTIDLMKLGMEKGIVPPRVTMQRVPAQIQKQIVDSPQDSLFYKPFKKIPAGFMDADRRRIQAEAHRVIESRVIPAYQKLAAFFNQEYLPACSDSIAAADLPNGRAYYEYVVRRFTTTDLTPDEVHELGLVEVRRNRVEMQAVIDEVGFEGSFQDFIHYLRTNPDFYYETPEELFDAYLAVAKRIDPHIPLLFNRLPKMPYGVKEIPAAVAPDTTTAYYMRPAADGSRAGFFYVNLYRPETRPKYEMAVLAVHEAVPGHHMQIALQQELEGLPNFRRFSGFTVFTEGWGLYSERLGYEIGLYQDPYSRFGQLTYDMWRAIRLVVDTGMHYKGWTRQQAIDYFKDNAAKTELDIINEIDRYISWPGQALAYKLGQLKFLELRAKAEEMLGSEFDLREFHDKVLENGAIPLSTLEAVVNEWLNDKLSERAAKPEVR